MWSAIGSETNGRVVAEVFAENAGIAGSDPAALKMLISGELDFFTLMGGILGQRSRSPRCSRSPLPSGRRPRRHAAADGALGAYLREEMAAKGITASRSAPSTTHAADLLDQPADHGAEGFRRPQDRLPAGQLFTDTFRALGAEPVTINVNGISTR